MGLTPQALEIIKRDSDLRAKLMLVPSRKNGKGKSEFTIKRWMDENSDILTMPKYVSVIEEHTGLSQEEIIAGKISTTTA